VWRRSDKFTVFPRQNQSTGLGLPLFVTTRSPLLWRNLRSKLPHPPPGHTGLARSLHRSESRSITAGCYRSDFVGRKNQDNSGLERCTVLFLKEHMQHPNHHWTIGDCRQSRYVEFVESKSARGSCYQYASGFLPVISIAITKLYIGEERRARAEDRVMLTRQYGKS
jgi:hypothetical protein